MEVASSALLFPLLESRCALAGGYDMRSRICGDEKQKLYPDRPDVYAEIYLVCNQFRAFTFFALLIGVG